MKRNKCRALRRTGRARQLEVKGHRWSQESGCNEEGNQTVTQGSWGGQGEVGVRLACSGDGKMHFDR